MENAFRSSSASHIPDIRATVSPAHTDGILCVIILTAYFVSYVIWGQAWLPLDRNGGPWWPILGHVLMFFSVISVVDNLMWQDSLSYFGCAR